ncbi:MAG TPA: ectoine synthase [Smithellaceae bacterium]|nr:ectoine synthase [Smithellaceae bacterium]HNV64505.1 ectoine synthase [Smithellaceae bacterium]HOD30593.1 ectoine synthase [Smithellaceae bacterium]HOZ60606.1 ectoine synthase [Smithellaceae bacterium]HPG53172.1 ectoine synthase [Smithellaceae bacterium]
MILRKLKDVIGTKREVFAENGNWVSRRLLLKNDDMGFSLHDTIIRAGTETHIWYKHHLEAVYCIEGEGEVELVGSGEILPINPGTIYALNKHDRHYLRAHKQDLRLICVFNPPVTGTEVHQADGSYAIK